MVGPSALGETAQNGFHELIGQEKVEGWETQLHNEPVFQVLGERTWRLPVSSDGDLDVDALPSLTAAAGTLRVSGQTGATFRLGQGLDSDYGVARLRPGLTGSDVFRPTRPLRLVSVRRCRRAVDRLRRDSQWEPVAV